MTVSAGSGKPHLEVGRLQLHSSYHQLSTVQSICLPGDTGNTGDTTSNCDTAVGGVGAVMINVAVVIHNYVLHTHIDTHIRAYVHGYTLQACQLSRIFRESHGFTDNLTFSRVGYSNSRILVVEENKFARESYKAKYPKSNV